MSRYQPSLVTIFIVEDCAFSNSIALILKGLPSFSDNSKRERKISKSGWGKISVPMAIGDGWWMIIFLIKLPDVSAASPKTTPLLSRR